MAKPDDDFEVINGGTMCASDFYEGITTVFTQFYFFPIFLPPEQGRLDGAFCNFTSTEKMIYLENLRENGVVNIEMESVPFAAMTFQAGIRAADVCVTLLDRLQGDQVISERKTEKKKGLRVWFAGFNTEGCFNRVAKAAASYCL